MKIITTVFFAGDTPEQAAESLLWDDEKGCQEFADENGLAHVYSLDVTGDIADMKEVT